MDHHPRKDLLTYAIAARSSLLFCSKGVFAKLAYAEGADTITVLALRMGFALPVFAAAAAVSSRRASPLTTRQWFQLAALGFIGYYLSSFVNFYGLNFITVGLERIVLFSYPALVVVGAAMFKKTTGHPPGHRRRHRRLHRHHHRLRRRGRRAGQP